MALTRWDPFTATDELFNRMMPSLFLRRMMPMAGGERQVDWLPSADISETDNEYLIRAELPAVKKEDVHVTAHDGMLTIEGERKQTSEEKNERFHRVESSYGSFSRSFSLPEGINIDGIRCESKDGVLTVHIPKSKQQKDKPKEIKVE